MRRGTDRGRGRLRGGAFRLREPILGRKRNTPNVAGRFEFERDLEKLAHGAWTLNPCDAAAYGTRRFAFLRVRDFQLDPHIFQDVMLGLIAAAVAIQYQGRGALHEWAAESIDTGH